MSMTPKIGPALVPENWLTRSGTTPKLAKKFKKLRKLSGTTFARPPRRDADHRTPLKTKALEETVRKAS
jgi:hypothetical protein